MLADASIGSGGLVFAAVVAGAAIVLTVYMLRMVDPVWPLTLSIAFSIFLSDHMGLPVSLDRLFLIIGLVVLALRMPGARGRPRLAVRPVHIVLGLALLYAVVSALASGTLNGNGLYDWVDRFGLLPFAMFFIAPVLYRGGRERDVLLKVMVVVGAYLGLTTLFETLHINPLVWPSYILDPSVGIHQSRARGPFAEAAANGMALFDCAVLATVAFALWRRRSARWFALAVAGLCLIGVLFTVTRAAWYGAIIAAVVTALSFRELRRYLIPAAVATAAGVLLAIVLVPGLESKVMGRSEAQRPIYVRKNLNTAAENMVLARPLLGFGWETFQQHSADYFRQASDYPLNGTNERPHNVFLANAAELGLIGLGIWLLALAIGLGGAILLRGPPELRPWRMAATAITLNWVVMANLGPAYYRFPLLLMWAIAGVASSWRLRAPEPEPTPAQPGAGPAWAPPDSGWAPPLWAPPEPVVASLGRPLSIAFLTTVLPGRRAGGGEVVSQAFVDALRACGYRVRVLGYTRPGEPPSDPDAIVAGVRPIETADASLRTRWRWAQSALSHDLPYTEAKYRGPAYREAARKLLADPECDQVVVDHAQLGWLADELREAGKPIVLIVHNVEAELYAERAGRGGGLRRMVHAREARLISGSESELADLADQVWTISSGDAAYFAERSPGGRVWCFGVPGAPGDPAGAAEPEFDVGLLGTWTWGPNAAGLRWFLDTVVPRLDPNTSVHVAGRGAEDLAAGRSGVTARGFVSDPADFLRHGRVVAVPAIEGAGVQVKTLDAIATGRPVVATSLALRGVDHPPVNVALADDPADFALALRRALAEPSDTEAYDAAVGWTRERRERFQREVAAAIIGAAPAPNGVPMQPSTNGHGRVPAGRGSGSRRSAT